MKFDLLFFVVEDRRFGMAARNGPAPATAARPQMAFLEFAQTVN
jgi:hypothetical protein